MQISWSNWLAICCFFNCSAVSSCKEALQATRFFIMRRSLGTIGHKFNWSTNCDFRLLSIAFSSSYARLVIILVQKLSKWSPILYARVFMVLLRRTRSTFLRNFCFDKKVLLCDGGRNDWLPSRRITVLNNSWQPLWTLCDRKLMTIRPLIDGWCRRTGGGLQILQCRNVSEGA